jgi:hypothetical protein
VTDIPPLRILEARAQARAHLYGYGVFELGEAIDPLLDYADDSGITEQLGDDAVIAIICEAFVRFARVNLTDVFNQLADS